MTETLVQWFVTHLGGKAAKELIIFIISSILSSAILRPSSM